MRISRILLVVGAIGVVLSGIGLVLDRLYPLQLHFEQLPPSAHVTIRRAPSQIVIADLAIDVPIEPGGVVNGKWTVAPTAANHLITSAHPGDKGNIIVYGHDSRSVLGRLKRAQVGQRVTLQNTGGEAHHYQIERVYTTTPADVSVIAPTNTELLTIYTCTGLFNEQRLVVQAKPTG